MLEDIVLNKTRKEAVSNVHSLIKQTFQGLTLEETLVIGFNWKEEKIAKVKCSGKLLELVKFFREWKYDKSKETLSSFRLYDQPAITRHAKYRAKYIQDMLSKGYSLNCKQTISQLEHLSCLGIEYSTVLYAIKCYLLANFTEDEIKTYHGIQPQTGPVYNTTMKLFCASDTNYQHTSRCNALAIKTGVSSTFINTVFYSLG